MTLLARLRAWLTHTPAGVDRNFPTREPRPMVHWDGERTVVDHLRAMRADGRLGPVKR